MRDPRKKTVRWLQTGLLFFTAQSIRRSRCFVKYLYYLCYYFYETKIYFLQKRRLPHCSSAYAPELSIFGDNLLILPRALQGEKQAGSRSRLW